MYVWENRGGALIHQSCDIERNTLSIIENSDSMAIVFVSRTGEILVSQTEYLGLSIGEYKRKAVALALDAIQRRVSEYNALAYLLGVVDVLSSGTTGMYGRFSNYYNK